MGKQSEAAAKKGHGKDAHGDEDAHAEDSEHGDEEAHASENGESNVEEEEEEHGGGHGESKGPTIEPFVVNLADSGSRRYLRLNLKLELKKRAETEPLLEARMP